MPQDAITLSRLSNELNVILHGAKINKITQPTQDEIILYVYSLRKTAKIAICANAQTARIGFTEYERKNPSIAPAFCMLLRKHLVNATIIEIAPIKNERIIKITFEGKNDFMEDVYKQMYCEIMGKYSNVIFCENDVILGSLKTSPLDLETERVLLSGVKYTLPKPQDKTDVFDQNAALATLGKFNGGNLGDFLFNNFRGFAPSTAKEIVFRRYGTQNFNGKLLDCSEFYSFIINFISQPTQEKSCVITCNDKLLDYTFCDYNSLSGEKQFFDTLCDAECYFFDHKQEIREFNDLKNKLLSIVNACLKKENKKLQIIYEKELSCQDMEKARKYGELITANIYKIKRGDKTVSVIDYYNDNATLDILLDEKLSPNANAQKYFKKYTKLKNTLKAITPQKEQAEIEKTYLLSILSEIESAQNVTDLNDVLDELKESGIVKTEEKISNSKKKADSKIIFRTFEYSGYKIRAGKNNVQNDRLLFMAKPSDVWLHVKDYHSAHVVIETQGGKLPDVVLEIAAEICAFYSEAKNGDKVPVDYTLKKHVKKPPKAKFGSVVYNDFKTVYVTPSSHKNLEI